MTDKPTTTQTKALHWLVTGYVSPRAKEWIEEEDGKVRILSSDPSLVAVALAYTPEGCWTWSHGQQEHRKGIEYWTTGEIQEASTGITLQYRSMDSRYEAAYCSANTTYLIMPDEQYDTETGQLKEEELGEGPLTLTEEELGESPLTLTSASNYLGGEDDLDDLDNHPF